ncbi:MAG: alkaline phosphatase [Bacteroidaceae bacterium]|nr:alkaline phosphatase [Bacteroidaceae bacterium]
MKVFGKIFVVLALFACQVTAKEAKYVFLFIGDGMGVNQVLGTEYYLGELAGHLGIEPLCFTGFPVSGLCTTYSASTDVTDSSAAATALSTGHKTANNVMGMLPDKTTPVEGIAEKAHKQGHRVAICSTVAINHATPAAFYAHTRSRDDKHLIGLQLADSGFEFFAGGDFEQNEDREDPAITDMEYAEESGYTIVRGYDEYKEKSGVADKMILLQKPRKDGKNEELVPSIDQTGSELCVSQITEAAIDFMMKDPSKGFFMMVEGGMIDDWLHGNDAASTFKEIIDFDNAIKLAYEFYKKHEKETLIVVTADHETAGLSLGAGVYRLALKNLQYQKISESAFARHLENMTKEKQDTLTWDEIKAELTEYFGFFDTVRINSSQEARLKDAYVKTFGNSGRRWRAPASSDDDAAKEEFYEYYKADALSDVAVKIMSEVSLINWSIGQHSAGYTPVFAVGVGSEAFTGQMDNTEIPVRMARAAGYKW